MGMTKASLDFQIQQETQKAIGQLQQNQEALQRMFQIVDGNMKQMWSVIMQDSMNMRVKVNFILDEMKKLMTPESLAEFENRFKVFVDAENNRMKEEYAAVIKAHEEKKNTREESVNDAAPQAAESNLIKP